MSKIKKEDIYAIDNFNLYNNVIEFYFIFDKKFYKKENLKIISEYIADIFINFNKEDTRIVDSRYLNNFYYQVKRSPVENQVILVIYNKSSHYNFSKIRNQIILEVYKELSASKNNFI